jgi:hypothetical protein
MIVPEIAGSAASELDELRAACDAAVERLLASGPARILVVGAGPEDRMFEAGTHDTFGRFGVPLGVRLGVACPTDGPAAFPLSVLIGGWLLGRSPMREVTARAVPDSWPVARCVAVGRELAELPEPVGLLVMGDGSACRGEKSPGYDDPRAVPYDDGVAAALAGTDVEALLDLDPDLSARLKVAGRVPWQVLAGAVRAAGGTWRGDLSYHAAPYGVAYFVATWTRPGAPGAGLTEQGGQPS